MAKIRFFVDLPNETLVFENADYDRPHGLPRVYHPALGWLRASRKVEMKSNPSRHKCDDRCVYATGRIMKCECSCGGSNHGKGNMRG